MKESLHTNKTNMLIYICINNLILIFQDIEDLAWFSELADSLVFINTNAENAILHKYMWLQIEISLISTRYY